MKQIKDLIVALEKVRIVAKQLHYRLSGEAFYANHKLMDRVQKPMMEFIDSLKEVCYLGHGSLPPTEQEIYSEVVDELVGEYDMQSMANVLNTAVAYCEEATRAEGIQQGDLNLIGNIAETLQNSLGLVSRVIAK